MTAQTNLEKNIEEIVKGGGAQSSHQTQLLTFALDDQLFGIPVNCIRDIFKTKSITSVPLTPPEIAGVVNLRGHIVTAINLRHTLGLPEAKARDINMNIAVDISEEMYSFIVDTVSEVLTLPKSDFEENPATLDDQFRELSSGIFKLDGRLLIVLDVKKLIENLEKESDNKNENRNR